MNRVLRKRISRDLRSNFGRYSALVLLIVMGIFLVTSFVGSAEAIIQGTENKKAENHRQDGQFSVFLPLTEEELSELSEGGTVIEPIFNTDLPAAEGRVLRLFRNREQTDLIDVCEGRQASGGNEALLERRFAETNGYSVGDELTAGGVSFKIVGLGSVPDYDAPLRNLSDTGVQSEVFGVIFVTGDEYDRIIGSTEQKAQEYAYSYRLGSGVTDDELKDKIKALRFDYTKVEDKYYKETIEEALEQKDKIESGVEDIHRGANELSDGLSELGENKSALNEGAQKLFDEYLSRASAAVSALGAETALTEDNYADILEKLSEADKSGQAASLRESLDSLKQFRDGIAEYTDGVSGAAEGADKLRDGIDEMKRFTDEVIEKEFVIDLDNLTSFLKASENGRIGAAAGDVIMNKVGGLIAGIIVLILFAYVISVFVVHQIESEASVIGALYALGVRKKDLLRHYITLPTVLTFVGALLGMAAAFTPIGIHRQMQDSYDYFSLPEFDYVYPPYLMIYALAVPPLISAAVNTLVINKKLSQTALSLIKNEQKASSYRQFSIKSKSFTRVFRIRQMVRELRSSVTVVLGMFISLLVIILGLNTYHLCNDVKNRNVRDTHYEYMYLLKYPEKEAPSEGEAAYIEGLKTNILSYTLEVSVIGLDENSRYFSARPEKGKSKAVIGSSLHERMGYDVGDKVTFSDTAADIDYTFTVTDICDYSPGFTVFMDIDSMRELFGKEDGHYNAVYSDKALDIDEGRLYSVTTKEEVRKSAGVFVEQMMGFIEMLTAAGSVIFCVVMYLMMGVMIDRSRFGISLIKIFGYRPKEIRALYLNGNFMIVALGGLICIPAAKLVMDAVYPSFVANVACCMDISYPWYIYLGIYCAMILIYLLINKLLMRKISRITPAEVLKNRE